MSYAGDKRFAEMIEEACGCAGVFVGTAPEFDRSTTPTLALAQALREIMQGLASARKTPCKPRRKIF